MSLALSTLIYEWRRYTAAVIALALSGLLILSMTGAFIGISKAVAKFIDHSNADIVIMGPTAKNISGNGGGGVPERLQPQIYMNPEVTRIVRLAGNNAHWVNNPKDGEDQKDDYIQSWGLDTYPGAPSLPSDFPESARIALMEPFTVAVDQSALKALGVHLGDTASMNGRAVRVAAVLTNYPNVVNTEIFASRDTLRMLGLDRGSGPGILMVSLKDPGSADLVRDQLNAASNGKYRAFTRAELAKANESIVFEQQIVGILLAFMVILGFLIGIGVTSMTLRGAIMANIKELASFRALGVSMGSLRLVILELSFWVGLVGVALAGLLVWGVTYAAVSVGMIMSYPIGAVVATCLLLIVIAMLSGVMTLGVLKKSQPADLLR